MNRSMKPLKSEVLISELLQTKNNPHNLEFGDQKYIYIMMLLVMYLLLYYTMKLVIICAVI